VCSALDADWRQMATSGPGRAAVRRWVEQDPCFKGADSGHDVFAMCRQGADVGCPVLRALLRVAVGDEFAQQTVMQVLLPGLLDLSRRGKARAGRTSRGRVDEDELEQQVVVIAFERIRSLAGTTQAWPARTLLDETWRRLRTVLENEERYRSVCQPVPQLVEIPSSADRSAAEHLAQLVVDAVRDGRLDRSAARLFYATRVLGERQDEVVPVAGFSRWTVSSRVARCAQVLADAS
jgi:hypothetical protein